MRLSVQMRVPLAEVLSWPDEHVRLQLAFMAAEPPTEDQILLGIAQLSALVFNRSRTGSEEGKAPADFLLFKDAWRAEEGPAPSTVTPEELQMLSHLMSAKPQPA